MAKVVSDSQRDWTRHLAPCVMAYNVSRHEATSFSPYYLMHGREAICPLDLLLETPIPDAPSDTNQYAENLVERLKSAFQIVARHSGAQVERMKRNYDADVRPKEFKLHDYVWYYYTRRYQGRTPKWSRYYTGPFRIEVVLNDVNFVLKKTPRSKPIVAHIDKLRRYFGSTPSCWKSVKMDASVNDSSANQLNEGSAEFRLTSVRVTGPNTLFHNASEQAETITERLHELNREGFPANVEQECRQAHCGDPEIEFNRVWRPWI